MGSHKGRRSQARVVKLAASRQKRPNRHPWGKKPPLIEPKLLMGCIAAFAVTVTIGLLGPQLPTLGNRLGYQAIRVIDGDTLRMPDGERVRLLNIDAPEMPPKSKCEREERLALEARSRLSQMIRGASDVTLRFGGDRDHDRYGRSLRYLVIDGRDAGEVLMAEGLAQPWRGHHAQWC